MYVRKVLHKEPFQYADSSTFNGTSTANLVSSGADWTITNNGTSVPYITSPAAGTAKYLTNYTTTTLPSTQCMFEIECNASAFGTEGVGLIFCANANAKTFATAYRLRQDATTLFIDEYASSTWSNVESFALNGTAGLDYFYRIIYFKAALTVQGISISGPAAGDIYVYRGTSYDNLAYVGKANDSSGLLSGGFFGPFKGNNATGVFGAMGAYGLWNLDVDYVDVKHKLDADSEATIGMVRNSEALNSTYSVGDRIEVWVPDVDMEQGTELVRLYFDGKVEVNPNMPGKDYYQAFGHTRELAQQHWNNGTATMNGTATSYLRTRLNSYCSPSGVNTSQTTTSVLHSNNLKTSIVESNRSVQAMRADMAFKKLCSEVGYSSFFFPDCRFFVTDTMFDPSITISSASQYLRMLEPEIVYDGKQITNVINNYYGGCLGVPVNGTNGTSIASTGVRAREVIDVLVNTSAVGTNVNSGLLTNYSENLAIVKMSLIQQFMNVFPGMKIGLILAGTGIGTNGTSDTDSWSAQSMTCNETHYDSRTGVHEIVLVPADSDSPKIRAWPLSDKIDPSKNLRNLGSQVAFLG